MGRPLTASVPHKLGRDEARRRIEGGFTALQRNMTGGLGGLVSFQRRWEGDRLHFEGGSLGQRVSGRLDVLEDTVQIEVDLPELLAAIADKVLGRLKQGTRKLLE